jgi:hypothetical protein
MNIMAYNTPELLLIGAAQTLVLGDEPKSALSRNWDFIQVDYTRDDGIPESNSW